MKIMKALKLEPISSKIIILIDFIILFIIFS